MLKELRKAKLNLTKYFKSKWCFPKKSNIILGQYFIKIPKTSFLGLKTKKLLIKFRQGHTHRADRTFVKL